MYDCLAQTSSSGNDNNTYIAGNIVLSGSTQVGHDDTVIYRLQVKTDNVLVSVIITFQQTLQS